MFPDIVGKGIRVEKHIDALIGGDIRRDILEQQIGEVVESVLNVVVLQIERAPLRVRHVTVAEGLPQIGEDDLLLVAEMLPQVALELGVEVGDEGAVLAVHRFEQRVEMVLDVGQLVVKVVAMRKQQILQDVGHGTLPQLVSWMAEKPAARFGMDRKGTIAPGKDSDLILVRLDQESLIDPEKFYSKGKNTPFAGWSVRAAVMRTIVAGRTVYEKELPL